MDTEAIFSVAAAIIASLGGSGLLVAALSNWIGKHWAAKFLEQEKAKHATALASIQSDLDLFKAKNFGRHNDKIVAYREAIHLLAEILAGLENIEEKGLKVIDEGVEKRFSLNRHIVYGYISLTSKQEVMDRYNDLVDYLIPIIYHGESGTWADMRTRADALLNSMRRDLGITDGDVVYKGDL